MPSKLPIIKANTTKENIDKMKVIAEANKRSVAKELEWLVERHIEEYEKKKWWNNNRRIRKWKSLQRICENGYR